MQCQLQVSQAQKKNKPECSAALCRPLPAQIHVCAQVSLLVYKFRCEDTVPAYRSETHAEINQKGILVKETNPKICQHLL
jgi:hypothetical protein